MGRGTAQLLLLPPLVMLFPPTLRTASEQSLNSPPKFISRGLMDTWELFSIGIAPAMAHPKVRKRRRGPMGGMLAQ